MHPAGNNPASSLNKVRRHARSQSADVSHLEIQRLAPPEASAARGPVSPHVSTRTHARAASRGADKRAGSKASPAPPPPATEMRASPLQLSPRSPRAVAPRPHRSGLVQETKKRQQEGATERVFGQMATATPDPGLGGRRYVDPSTELLRDAKKSHRRAHSMASQQQREVAQLQAEQHHARATANQAPPNVTINNAAAPQRSRRLPSAASQSQHILSLHSAPSVPVYQQQQQQLQQLQLQQQQQQQQAQLHPPNDSNVVASRLRKKRHEELGHRRSNSWDPRKAPDTSRAAPSAHPQPYLPGPMMNAPSSMRVSAARTVSTPSTPAAAAAAGMAEGAALASEVEAQLEGAADGTLAVDMGALEAALAARKAELLAKEMALMEKQRNTEAELRTLVTGTSLEREVEELLRVQRAVSQQSRTAQPYRRFDVRSPLHSSAGGLSDGLSSGNSYLAMLMGAPRYVLDASQDRDPDEDVEEDVYPDDEALADHLEEELEDLKLRTLQMEHRVKELRCPGPTPLEMVAGMSRPVVAPSLANERPFSSSLPANVRRVQARRSPDDDSLDKWGRASSPNQEYALGGLSSPFKSAFSSFSNE